MNRTDHLLVILAEEAAEVAQAASKCLRFTAERIHPGYKESNAEHLMHELNDLLAVVEMLQSEWTLSTGMRDEDKIAAKKLKVEKHLECSKEVGRLE